MSYYELKITNVGTVTRDINRDFRIVSGIEYEIHDEDCEDEPDRILKSRYPGKLKLTVAELNVVNAGQGDKELAMILIRGMFRVAKWKIKYVQKAAIRLWNYFFVMELDLVEASRADYAAAMLKIAFGVESREFAEYAYKGLLDNGLKFVELSDYQTNKLFACGSADNIVAQTMAVRFTVYRDWKKKARWRETAGMSVFVDVLVAIIHQNNSGVLREYVRCATQTELLLSVRRCLMMPAMADDAFADIAFSLLKTCSKAQIKKQGIVLEMVLESVSVKIVERYLRTVNSDVHVRTGNFGEALSQALQGLDLERTKLLIHYGGDVAKAFDDVKRWRGRRRFSQDWGAIQNEAAMLYATEVLPLYKLLRKKKSRPLSSYAKYYANPDCVKAASLGIGIGAVEKALKSFRTTVRESAARRL